jgi:hypothetical protein
MLKNANVQFLISARQGKIKTGPLAKFTDDAYLTFMHPDDLGGYEKPDPKA